MKRGSSVRERWIQWIEEQEKSGKSVPLFCHEQGLAEYSFYRWRQRLRQEPPVTFALVDTSGDTEPRSIELILTSGDRLRLPSEAATLRMVLSVLRERA